MSDAPERIWIEDEFGDGDEDQWTYGTWDVRNYRGYDVEYVRADIVQALTAERDNYREVLTALHKQALMLRGEQAYREFARAVEKQARAALKGETP